MILEAREVGFRYPSGDAVLTDVSFGVTPGRSVALVGESAAGKTTLLRLLLGLRRPTSGAVLFQGAPLPTGHRAAREFRRHVQTVFQDPYSSLDPRQKVSRIVAEPLRALGFADHAPRVAAALSAVGLPDDAVDRYPHEFSGGPAAADRDRPGHRRRADACCWPTSRSAPWT